MNSYVFDIGGKARTVARFIGEVRAQLQMALIAEKKTRKLTQQKIAKLIGTDRAVINRQIMGYENLTIRRVAELAWALGWEIVFYLKKRDIHQIIIDLPRELSAPLQPATYTTIARPSSGSRVARFVRT